VKTLSSCVPWQFVVIYWLNLRGRLVVDQRRIHWPVKATRTSCYSAHWRPAGSCLVDEACRLCHSLDPWPLGQGQMGASRRWKRSSTYHCRVEWSAISGRLHVLRLVNMISFNGAPNWRQYAELYKLRRECCLLREQRPTGPDILERHSLHCSYILVCKWTSAFSGYLFRPLNSRYAKIGVISN